MQRFLSVAKKLAISCLCNCDGKDNGKLDVTEVDWLNVMYSRYAVK